MKNKYFERLRELAKQDLKSHNRGRSINSDGIAVYHLYDGEYAKEKAYWDDTGFRMGSQWVGVYFTHPRYEYTDHCNMAAYDEATKFLPRSDNLFDSIPEYKKVGKSRKKIKWYKMNSSDDMSDFYGVWTGIEKTMLMSCNFKVIPSMKVTQCKWGRSVDICVPEEVVNEAGLKMLCDIVKASLADPNYFKFRYAGYEYSCDDFNQEFPKGLRCHESTPDQT